MSRLLPVLVLLILMALPFTADTLVFGASEEADFQPLADEVWAHVQREDHRFQDCNTTIIDHPELGLLLVDPPAGEEASRRLLMGLKGLSNAPVRYIILTHFHGDHTQGNDAVRKAFPDVLVVGHESLRQDIPERAAQDHRQRVDRLKEAIPAAEAQLATGKNPKGEAYTEEQLAQERAAIQRAKDWLEANQDAVFLIPDLSFIEAMTLGSEAFPVRLIHFSGHTRGDAVVYLPKQKILAAGDLVDAMPYAGHGFPREWLNSLQALSALPVEQTVPGHGPIFEEHRQVKLLIGFFQSLIRAVDTAQAEGRTLEDLQAAPPGDLMSWRDKLAGEDPAAQRFFDGTLKESLEAAWREQR